MSQFTTCSVNNMKILATLMSACALVSLPVVAAPIKFNCEGVSVVYSPLQIPVEGAEYRPIGLVVRGISATNISTAVDWSGSDDDSMQIIGTINNEPVNLMYRPLKKRVDLYSGAARFKCEQLD